MFIESNFGFLPDITNSFEAKYISLSVAIQVIQDVSLKLNEIPSTVEKIVKDKINELD